MSMTLPAALLSKHRKRTFVETGTHEGRGIALALQVGFSVVHSIEVDPGRFALAWARYSGVAGVHVHLADSTELLPQLLSSLDESCTFWLDAHPFPDQTVRRLGRHRYPLLEELRAFSSGARQDHTILIDDRADFSSPFGTSEAEIVELIYRINPEYRISVEDSTWRKKDILIAEYAG